MLRCLDSSRSLPFAFPSLSSATRTTDAILYSYIGFVLQARSDVHLAPSSPPGSHNYAHVVHAGMPLAYGSSSGVEEKAKN